MSRRHATAAQTSLSVPFALPPPPTDLQGRHSHRAQPLCRRLIQALGEDSAEPDLLNVRFYVSKASSVSGLGTSFTFSPLLRLICLFYFTRCHMRSIIV